MPPPASRRHYFEVKCINFLYRPISNIPLVMCIIYITLKILICRILLPLLSFRYSMKGHTRRQWVTVGPRSFCLRFHVYMYFQTIVQGSTQNPEVLTFIFAQWTVPVPGNTTYRAPCTNVSTQ